MEGIVGRILPYGIGVNYNARMSALLLTLFLAQGVTADAVLIGMEGHTGSFSVDEENLGMRLVITEVNEQGGVHGRQLVEKSYPRTMDNYADRQMANVRRLVEEDGVFLIFNFGGPASVRIGDYAMENSVPYLFPHTALLTVDGHPYVFTSFPRYEGETRVMFRYLAEELGVKRLATLFANNVYGQYFASRARVFADELGYEVVASQPLPRLATSAGTQMAALKAADPEAVIIALYPAGARRAIEAKAALAWDVRLVSSGPLTDEQYFNIEGGHAEGTLGFCHYPDPNESEEPGIVEYRRLMAKHYPGHALNRYSLYGYVFGKLVVEGLERAGPDPTRERFVAAMETIRDWDSGGIMPPVTFTENDHHAQKAGFICELRDGRFRARTDWIAP